MKTSQSQQLSQKLQAGRVWVIEITDLFPVLGEDGIRSELVIRSKTFPEFHGLEGRSKQKEVQNND